MKKTVYILLDDYYHPKHTILPAIETAFPKEKWEMVISDDISELKEDKQFDLIVTFRDGMILKDDVRTYWYTEVIESMLRDRVKNGTGLLVVHCGLANYIENGILHKEVIRGRFISHPAQCPVTSVTTEVCHPITEGIESFTVTDEHYFTDIDETATNVLMYSESINGKTVSAWAHELGEGRVAAITPGHTTEVLTHPTVQKLMVNGANWCIKG